MVARAITVGLPGLTIVRSDVALGVDAVEISAIEGEGNVIDPEVTITHGPRLAVPCSKHGLYIEASKLRNQTSKHVFKIHE